MSAGRRVLIGRIAGVFGVRGWVKLESHTEPREALLAYRPWILRLRGNERELEPVEARPHGPGLVARLPGIEDRDRAEALVGAEIWIAREQLPPPAAGEYYWVDLIGLAVRTVDGVPLGQVRRMLATGANDVMVLHDGTRERLVPFIPGDVVRAVEIEAGCILVDWDPDF